MKKEVEIINNSGKKVKVSKQFADALNKSRKLSLSRGENFGQSNEVPIEEFEEKEIEKSEENELKGGKGDKQTIESLAKKHNVSKQQIKEQIKQGVQVEMEHTNNSKIALEIVIDHLFESAEYYTKLREMEKEFKDE